MKWKMGKDREEREEENNQRCIMLEGKGRV